MFLLCLGVFAVKAFFNNNRLNRPLRSRREEREGNTKGRGGGPGGPITTKHKENRDKIFFLPAGQPTILSWRNLSDLRAFAVKAFFNSKQMNRPLRSRRKERKEAPPRNVFLPAGQHNLFFLCASVVNQFAPPTRYRSFEAQRSQRTSLPFLFLICVLGSWNLYLFRTFGFW